MNWSTSDRRSRLPDDWPARVAAVKRRDKGRCQATHHAEDCDGRGTDVDHIDGQGPSSPRGHDWSNLQAMCHACHTRKTNTHDGGGWNRNA